MTESKAPTSYGLLLFPGFEVLDAAGPIECLNMLLARGPTDLPLTLSIIGRPDPSSPSTPLDLTPAPPDPSQPGQIFKAAQIYRPTHTFSTAPPLDVLIVPGGIGTRNPHVQCAEELGFIKRVFPSLKCFFTICTGSLLAAAAGVLDGHRATSNKAAWKTVTAEGPRTHWIAKARWVVSGKVWTTSGVSAGTDGMVAFLASVYGEELAGSVVDAMEYRRQADAEDDPFAELYSVKDVLPKE